MAKSSITNISANNTFQTWFDKTNELVNLVKTDILTATSATDAGDTTVGNVTLEGIFTADNVIVNDLLIVDEISPKVGSTSIGVTAPVIITTNLTTVLSRFASSNGPRLSFFNNSDTDWQVGFENNTTKNFTISNGGASFKLTPAGNIELSGILSGTSSVASTVTLVATNTTDATHFPVFVDSATGNENIRTDTGFTYNPSTGILTSTAFAGNLTGNADTVTNGVYTIGNQTISGTKTFSATITGSITGNSGTVTNGVYTIGNQTINGIKTFNNNTASTNTTTGSIVITGGLGISGAINAGGAISSNGDITAFASSSDIRKKENIVRIDNALQKVLQIGGYTYNFKNDDRKLAGVIAQELEQVLPEVVYEIDDDEFGKSKAVRYGNIVGLLIEAIKELKAELDELKGL
jgi:hypothetical protein